MSAFVLLVGILIGLVAGVTGTAFYYAAVDADEEMARHVNREYTVQKGGGA